jgi:hypothetical protein
VVVKRRLNTLEPARAFLEKVLIETHLHSSVEDLRRRYPRFWDATLDQQSTQMASISAVRLGPTLLTFQGRRLGRLGDMRPYPGPAEPLHHIAPSRTPL